ncbi:hypothetical protein OE88DRAFT_1646242 [Heliocybe sulcata]|uniref:Uncharacterized protein n=1 Tax=Heliocybe sulcata TaxID=5364 RepID=A0A5C3MYE8_9AGAM|nr:hypothetical protein OE88DRAFT_1646242 [Heliocybe sulcata]
MEFICTDCGSKAPIKAVKSDRSGNKGRLYAKCFKYNMNAPSGRCSYYRWVTPKNSSAAPSVPDGPPSSDPAPQESDPVYYSGDGTPSDEELVDLERAGRSIVLIGRDSMVGSPPSLGSIPRLVPPVLPPVRAPSPALAATLLVSNPPGSVGQKCKANKKCGTTRVHEDCWQSMCRKHCREHGGCAGLVKHKVEGFWYDKSRKAVAAPAVPAAPTAGTLVEPITATRGYSSQLPAIFTEQYQREQEMYENKRRADATRAEAERKLYESSRTWFTICIGHTVDVRAYKQHLFLHATSVTKCLDLSHLYGAAMVEMKPHLRLHLPEERRAVRRASESLSVYSEASSSKGRRDDDSGDWPRRKFRAVSSPTSPVGLGLSLGSRLTSFSPSLSPSSMPLSWSPSPSAMEPLRLPAVEHETTALLPPAAADVVSHHEFAGDSLSPASFAYFRRWPQDFHACDIQSAFVELNVLARHGHAIGTAFTQRFGVPFKSSTFYDHRDRWLSASQEVRDNAVKAGLTEAGLWSAFMKLTSGNESDRKARKKKRAVCETPEVV